MRLIKKIFYRVIYNIFCIFPGTKYICFIEKNTSSSYGNINALWEKIIKIETLKSIKIDGTDFTIKNLWKISQSKVIIIDQSNKILSHLSINSKSTCIQIWHSGGLYKKIGFNAMRKGFDYIKECNRLYRIHKNIDYFIISDKKLIEFYAHAFRLRPEQIIPLGLSRTDYLYTVNCENAKKNFWNNFPSSQGKKILLYAPTFRSDSMSGTRTHRCQLDITLLTAFLGESWCFAFRRHPSVTEEIPVGWIDVSHIPQEECLAMSDALVTDYSSILFDYAFFRRPIFLFISDIEAYKNTQRNFYINPTELVGIQNICYRTEDLIQKIKKGTSFNCDIWEKFMSACDGNSTEKIVNFIKKIYGEK